MRIVLLTGVSGSGKTSIQEELLKRGWVRPINFSTRSPRNPNSDNIDLEGDYISNELNEYVFLDKDKFLIKLGNGDLIESTQYGGNLYGISNFLKEYQYREGNRRINLSSPIRDKNIIIVVDPVGRAQISEYLERNGISYSTFYLYITQETQRRRLEARGDTQEEIKKRSRDFNWFHSTNKCVRLNAELSSPIELANFIENHYN